MNAPTPSGEVKIRLAGPADIHRIASHLPQGLSQPINTRYLIAERCDSAELLGGAYFRVAAMAHGVRVASLRLAVHPEILTDDTAMALMAVCLSAAEHAGAQGAVYDCMVEAGSLEESLLLRFGFVSIQTLIDYEIDCRAALAVIDRTMRHLSRSGKVPAEAIVIPLDEAPITPVNTLVAHYLGGSIDALSATVLPHISTVATVGPRVVGVTLSANKGRGIDIPYTVNEPGFRNSWVTPAMWRRVAECLIEAGHDKVTYSTNSEQFKNMSNFTRRLGAKETSRQVRYGRGLQA